jgi:hypothetical protein
VIELPKELVELLAAHEARQIGLIAQIDQLQAAVREMQEWMDMCEGMKSQDV